MDIIELCRLGKESIHKIIEELECGINLMSEKKMFECQAALTAQKAYYEKFYMSANKIISDLEHEYHKSSS